MKKQAIVFGSDSCPFTVKAVHLLENHAFEVLKLDRKFMSENFSTIPQIFIDGHHIGGYSNLLEKFNTVGVLPKKTSRKSRTSRHRVRRRSRKHSFRQARKMMIN